MWLEGLSSSQARNASKLKISTTRAVQGLLMVTWSTFTDYILSPYLAWSSGKAMRMARLIQAIPEKHKKTVDFLQRGTCRAPHL
jgi:hypothetical protein